MNSSRYKGIELFLLFIVLPISFTLSYPNSIKAVLTLVGFGYILYMLKKAGKLKVKFPISVNWSSFWKAIGIQLCAVIVCTTAYVYWVSPESLFYVVRHKPLLWVAILFIYTFFSVFPQELIYRTFFFERYQSLFKSTGVLIFVNAIVFSLAHIFFQNTLVQVLTFIGGLFFAYTYHKTKSTLLVSIEHAIYGNWLFTVGMGQMLAFPGMP